MKVTLATFLVAALLATAWCDEGKEGKGGKGEVMKKFMECCKEKLQIEDRGECFKNLKEHKDSKEEKYRCFAKCVLEKKGIIKNGEFIKDGAEVAQNNEKKKEAINECLKQKEGEGDICDQATRVAQCLKKKHGHGKKDEKKEELVDMEIEKRLMGMVGDFLKYSRSIMSLIQ